MLTAQWRPLCSVSSKSLQASIPVRIPRAKLHVQQRQEKKKTACKKTINLSVKGRRHIDFLSSAASSTTTSQ